MKITLTDKHKHYTIAGRIAILHYQTLDNNFVGMVTGTANLGEANNLIWTDEGECLTNPKHNLLHTLNYKQLADLFNVTYATIRLACNIGVLGLTPIFPNKKEKVFDKQVVLTMLTKLGKTEVRRLVINAYREAVAKKYLASRAKMSLKVRCK